MLTAAPQTLTFSYFKNEFVQDLNEYKLFRKTKTKWLQKDRFQHEIFSNNTVIKLKRFQKVAWVQTPRRLCQWKFKLWAGKFAWGVKAKHCWALSTNFWKQKVCWHQPAMFCLITSSKFEFLWRWRWWDPIQAIFLNLFYINASKIIQYNGIFCRKFETYDFTLKWLYFS